MLPPAGAAPNRELRERRSFLGSFGAARERPLLDPREVVIGAITMRPHRENERTVRRTFVIEAADQRREVRERRIGSGVGTLVFQFDDAFFAGRIAAIE